MAARMILRPFLLWLSRRRALGSGLERLPLTARVVRRFVAGRSEAEVVRTAQKLIARGFRVNCSLLGEQITHAAQADAAVRRYQALLEAVAAAGIGPETKIAVKPTLLGLELDAARAAVHLSSLLDAADAAGVGVELDMERAADVDATLALFRHAAAVHPTLGVALQAYLKRSAADLDGLIEDGVARVRLVKGAYAEAAAVAYRSSDEITGAFHLLMRRLLDPAATRSGASLSLGTHDLALIAAARGVAHRQRTPEEAWEVQMLMGVRAPLQARLRREGYRVRVYLPYGEQWYPYFVRRIAERPAHLWFALLQIASR